MPKAKATPVTKILGLVIIGLIVFFGFKFALNSDWMGKIAPKKGSSQVGGGKLSRKEAKDAIKIGVVTWGGYAGGQYFNNGFKANKESRFYTDYGILVEFKVIDDFNASRAAWKADEVNLMWITADAFPTEVNALKDYEPRIIFQADWSRGGDAIVVRRGINTVEDLRDKKVAVAYGTPSHTFLLWMLDANNMGQNNITAVEVPSAIDAATMFKSGQVDAAVVWSPDDEDCIQKVNGASILKSTKQATHIIADVFYAKQSYIDQHEEELKGLITGWLRGAAEINSSVEAKKKAAQILSDGMDQDFDFCLQAINNVRLCTYGDNKGFFEIEGCGACVTGEQLYTKMSQEYAKVGIVKGSVPAWRSITYTGILRNITLAGSQHEAEGMQQFAKPSQKEINTEAYASKSVSIVFASGSATLDDNAKYILDSQVIPVLKALGGSRVRVEGNTDNVGNKAMNMALSRKRAQAAIEHCVRTAQFDPNRFVSVGNGPDKPVADNNTIEGRARNRRTEFQFLN